MAHDVRLIRSPVSVAGMVLTTISAVIFLVVFLAELFGLHTNPYLGILFFLILPTVFLVGLLLIPVGAWIERRRLARGLAASAMQWPRLDLNDARHRRIAVGLFALTMANIVIVSLAAHRGVEYMDSVAFCGQVCHQVMQPELVSHSAGPHARVACVQGHIAPGAGGFADAKASGVRQLLALARDTVQRPIPTPVRSLPPASEICQRCHWPDKLHGDTIRRVVEYAEDEANTETVTELALHVGGGSAHRGIATGIHWHMNIAHDIEFIATDDRRQEIPYVKLTDRNGTVTEYTADGVTPDQLAAGERRRMDCLDCHNRPSHTMTPSPERAVNTAMTHGDIPKTLPFVRLEAVKALKVEYPSHEAATQGIERSLREFYREFALQRSERVPAVADLDRAISATTEIYRTNVFPQMRVTFGTYPNHLGHVDSPGCFRCHDDNHKTRDGKTIPQECETCHQMK